MSPPLPPSPPDGPPRGTYFSLRNAPQPLLPSPPFTEILASSTNMGHPTREGTRIELTLRSGSGAKDGSRQVSGGDSCQRFARTRHAYRRGMRTKPLVCSGLGRLRGARGGIFRREDADEAALAALVLKQHEAVDQREKRIVLGARDVLAGLVTRAALADQDAAAADGLAAETLYAQPLAVGIASVCR